MRLLLLLLYSLILSGCVSVPEGVKPVNNFQLDQYLGRWYEIARLDNRFERGLEQVTAEYTLQQDGSIRVINRGFSPADNRWKQAEGKARFVADPDQGYLKVSFFGPFYSAYVVFGLDQAHYQYAFVCGYDRSYLWLLARSPRVSEQLIQRFITRSGELGFATDNLIFIEHPEVTKPDG